MPAITEPCLWCTEPVERGYPPPADPADQCVPIINGVYHRACMFRAITGSIAHVKGECSCYGGDGHDPPGMTKRKAARLVWDYVQTVNPWPGAA